MKNVQMYVLFGEVLINTKHKSLTIKIKALIKVKQAQIKFLALKGLVIFEVFQNKIFAVHFRIKNQRRLSMQIGLLTKQFILASFLYFLQTFKGNNAKKSKIHDQRKSKVQKQLKTKEAQNPQKLYSFCQLTSHFCFYPLILNPDIFIINQVVSYQMSFKVVMDAINLFLGITLTGLKLGYVGLNQQLKDISSQMKKEIEKKKQLLNIAKPFLQNSKIIKSSLLQIQKNSIQVVLKASLQEIQQYYQSVLHLMKNHKHNDFHILMKDMPGSINYAWLQIISSVGSSLFGLKAYLSIYSIYTTNQSFKKWKRSNPSYIQGYTLGVIIDSIPPTYQFANQSITNALDLPQIMKIHSIRIAIQIFIRHVSSFNQFRGFLQYMFLGQYKQLVNQIFTMDNIYKTANMIGNIASIILAINTIVQSQIAVEKAKQQLEKLKKKLKQFFDQCLGILYNIQQLLTSIEAQLYSFSAFLSYVKLICKHNLLASQDHQKIALHISRLQIKQINKETFESITVARGKLQKALQGIVIIKKETIINNQKRYIYQTSQTFQSIKDRFQASTAIISDLDEKIRITDIYNSYYQRLKEAQIIMRELTWKKPMNLVKFVSKISYIINNKESLQQIQSQYKYYFQRKELIKEDQYIIAKAISFITDVFPKDSQNTKVYGYQLSSFKEKYGPQEIIERNTKIQDIDMGKIMGTWPEDMKKESIEKIIEKTNVAEGDLRYCGSSIYIQNKGTINKPKQRLFKLQVYQKNEKERYYVLYDSVTNVFQDVRIGFQDIEKT